MCISLTTSARARLDATLSPMMTYCPVPGTVNAVCLLVILIPCLVAKAVAWLLDKTKQFFPTSFSPISFISLTLSFKRRLIVSIGLAAFVLISEDGIVSSVTLPVSFRLSFFALFSFVSLPDSFTSSSSVDSLICFSSVLTRFFMVSVGSMPKAPVSMLSSLRFKCPYTFWRVLDLGNTPLTVRIASNALPRIAACTMYCA